MQDNKELAIACGAMGSLCSAAATIFSIISHNTFISVILIVTTLGSALSTLLLAFGTRHK